MNLRLLLTILSFLIICSIAASVPRKNDPCYAPIDSITKKPTFLVAESPAEIEGGMESLARAMLKRVLYPSALEMKNFDGSKILVGFIVDERGKVTGKRIISTIKGTNIAEQILTVLAEFKWKPGTCNGKPVSTFHVYPMIICLKE